jgi:hypothetical protein
MPAARALDPTAERDRVRGHPLRELREQAGRGLGHDPLMIGNGRLM